VDTIPEYEWQIYRDTVDQAIGLAMLDQAGAGFHTLQAGLRRAVEMEDGRQVWTAVLIHKYRDALDRFTERWGAKLLE